MRTRLFPLLACWALAVTACSGRTAPDALTSPLDYEADPGLEMWMEVKEYEDDQLTLSGTISGKILAPGPLPGTSEIVARGEFGWTLDTRKRGRTLIRGFTYFRLNAQVEETLGIHFVEVNGHPIDGRKMYELPYVNLKAPLVLGARWEFRHISTDDHPKKEPTPFRYALRVQATELTLDLPAGRFERCIRLVAEGHSEKAIPVTCGQRQLEKQVLKHATVYYCPHLGSVRELNMTRYGEPGHPDPACPTKRSEIIATRLIHALADSTRKK